MAAEATLEQIIEDARNFAQVSFDEATSLVSSAQGAARSSVSLTPRSLFYTAPAAEPFDHSSYPGLFEDGFTVPFPKPESGELQQIHIPTLPDFPDAPPALDTSSLFQIDKPVFDVAGFTKTAPEVDTDIAFPSAPTIREYEAPETTPLSLRETPTVTVPGFDPDVEIRDPGDVPDIATTYQDRIRAVVPEMREWIETYADAWISKYAPSYHDAMAQLEAKLSDAYAGNTALPDAVERQIFDRGVARAEDQRANLDVEANERMARRGYRLPAVALAAQLGRNQETVARAAAEVARDTAIKRADMETQHLQFVIQVSASLRDAMRGQVLQYANLLLSLNGQALQDAQQLAGIMSDVYRLLVQRSQLDLEHLRILASIFETRMKAALADIEIFKVEMEAAKLRKDVELTEVDVWFKKIQAEEQRINLYLAELRGITERVGVERLRIDIFGREVDAYTALVQAKSAEFQAYRAAIDGDEALVRAYSEQVRAYATEVDAARTKVQAESAMTEAGAQYNRNLIDVFKSELDAWGAELDAEGKRFSSAAEAYRTRLELYKTRIAAQLDEQRNRYESGRLELEAKRAQTDADVRVLLAQGELFQSRNQLVASTAISGANAHASMASSAVSAQNTMVNLVNETVNG
jgi:hypothetical protein